MSPLARARIAGRHAQRRLGHVDALGLPLGVRLGDQLGNRQVFLHLRVGVKLGPIGERQFLCLGVKVDEVGRVVAHRGDVVLLEDVQNLQRGDALAVRWQFPDVVATIAGADRLDPVRGVSLEIFHRDQTTDRYAVAHDLLRDPAFVKRLRPLLADGTIDLCQVAVGHAFAFPRRAAVLEKCPAGGRRFAENRFSGLPIASNDLRHGKAVPRVTNRRRKRLSQRQFAEPIVQRLPAGDAARHRPTQRPLERDAVMPALADELARNPKRRTATGVEAVKLLRLGVPHDGKQVAADTAAHRLHHAEHGVGGDGGVDRVATALKHIDTGLRSERVARSNHAAGRHHHRAAELGIAGRSVVAGTRHL